MKKLLILIALAASLGASSQGVKISAMPTLADPDLIAQAYFPVVYNLTNYKVLGEDISNKDRIDSIINSWPAGASEDRFGKAGQDVLAAEERIFNQSGNLFTIHGGVFRLGTGDYIDQATDYSLIQNQATGYFNGRLAGSFFAYEQANVTAGNLYFKTTVGDGSTSSVLEVQAGHISLNVGSQGMFVHNLIDSTQSYVIGYNPTNKKVTYFATPSGGSSARFGVSGEDVSASADRAFDVGAHTFTHTYNSLAGEGGFNISSTSTLASGDIQKLVNVTLSGANATSGELTTAIHASNTHTGTSSTNIAVRGVATGGTTFNHAFWGTSDGGGATVLGENSGNGNGVQGSAGASGAGVYGSNTSNGYGVYATSNGGFGLQAVTFNTVTNTRLSVARFTRQIATNTAAANIGGQIILEAPTTTASSGTTAANIGWSWDDPANTTRSGRIDFSVVENGAAAATVLTIDGSGNVMLEQSGKALAIEDNTGVKWYITVNTSGVLSTSTTAP